MAPISSVDTDSSLQQLCAYIQKEEKLYKNSPTIRSYSVTVKGVGTGEVQDAQQVLRNVRVPLLRFEKLTITTYLMSAFRDINRDVVSSSSPVHFTNVLVEPDAIFPILEIPKKEFLFKSIQNTREFLIKVGENLEEEEFLNKHIWVYCLDLFDICRPELSLVKLNIEENKDNFHDASKVARILKSINNIQSLRIFWYKTYSGTGMITKNCLSEMSTAGFSALSFKTSERLNPIFNFKQPTPPNVQFNFVTLGYLGNLQRYFGLFGHTPRIFCEVTSVDEYKIKKNKILSDAYGFHYKKIIP